MTKKRLNGVHHFSMNLPHPLYMEVRTLAFKSEQSMTEIVVAAINAYLDYLDGQEAVNELEAA
jgi:hypothetical protein